MTNMITTTKGDMPIEALDRFDGMFENENELTTWVEYRLKGDDEIIHRSVHLTLKQPLISETQLGE